MLITLFQQSRRHKSQIYDPIWPVFKLIPGFIHDHLNCKFQEDLMKTEQVKQRLFQQSGDVFLKLM